MRAKELDSNDLLTRSKREIGLYDFGEGSFREGLDVLVDALNSEANLTRAERRRIRDMLVDALVRRLEIRDRVKKSTAAHNPPLVVVGPGERGDANCEQLLLPTFHSAVFATWAAVPSYESWLSQRDMTPAYEFLRVQHIERLAFESRRHLCHVDELRAVYPDVVFRWGCLLPR